ncbi:hypothetical protein FSP39_005811 [Pinctada imbricata]|uniref:Protein kinase domain-containing protein n=1 Tax=Pinctada imbricata TaxID=66713 RepID=A0AA89BSR1_PINIB|nr:hypothetical protein FSP39_005811 [Pinctada imbricata]
MTAALLHKENMNVIAVDWSKGADYINYFQAAANTRVVGAVIAKMMEGLHSTAHAAYSNMHVVGHSLGAHIGGYVGERIHGLGRITGLDPAGPCFEEQDVQVRLDPNDANYVDVIHTDGDNLLALGFFLHTSKVCYKDLGCFANDNPYSNSFGALPSSPDDMQIKMNLYTRDNIVEPTLILYNETSSILDSHYDGNKPTKIVIHGYMSDATEDWVLNISNLYLKREDVNVIAVDWKSGANKIYPQAVANTRVVGAYVARLLKTLRDKFGANMEDVHIIGHSLGAQTGGYIGSLTPKLGRITGMDPAGPLFEKYDSIVRLDPGDATFVDVIHTDALPFEEAGFGTRLPAGHIDFYPNGGGHQPGCPPPYKTGVSEMFTLKFNSKEYLFAAICMKESMRYPTELAAFMAVACSHQRSYYYFAESLTTEKCKFTSYPCASYAAYRAGNCTSCGDGPCPIMGADADQYKARRGDFYLTTNSQNPYCNADYGKCSPNCQTGCSKLGHCIGGCNPGWKGKQCDQNCDEYSYGVNCGKMCGHCKNDEQCDIITGSCPNGCVAGWTGHNCKEACPPFTYGDKCRETCGHCRLGNACNVVTGVCSQGCNPGWSGERCDQACPVGTYGRDCVMTCGRCKNNKTCDSVTGECLNLCTEGWMGLKCDQHCPPGFFGRNCTAQCGKCASGTCDPSSGKCQSGCKAGWTGPTCASRCSNGWFGPNCKIKCGQCKNLTFCDAEKGICASGCQKGWKGLMCNRSCKNGYYGNSCSFKCGKCVKDQICNKSTGFCPNGCALGFKGLKCLEVSDEAIEERGMMSLAVPVLVSCIVLLVILFSMTTVYFLCIRPRHGRLFSKFYRLSTRSLQIPEIHIYEEVLSGTWELNKYNLFLTNEKLGHGQFGMVKKGFVKKDRTHRIPVAVKSIKGSASEKDRNDFINELNILKKVGQHPNVVCLVGACHIQGTMYVAMEYCKNGDLRTYLRRLRKSKNNLYANAKVISPVQKSVLLKLSLDVASGLSHLAEKQIIHRDVAARNVLLDEHLIAKVADFGLSKHDDTYVKTSNTRVPVRWLAPESLFNALYTTQSDVWSFGVLLWEIATLGGTPYHGLDTQQMCNLIKQGFRMRRPRNCDPALYAMMLQCWYERPESRPCIKEIVSRLQRMLEDSQVYMNLDLDVNEGNQYAEIN